jgi:hypothetical protein
MFDRNKQDMKIWNKIKENLHLSQKLCWQQGIITASLKISLHRRHLNSVGISALNIGGRFMTPLHNHNLYKFKKQLFFSETFFKRDRHKFIVQQSIKGKKKSTGIACKKI